MAMNELRFRLRGVSNFRELLLAILHLMISEFMMNPFIKSMLSHSYLYWMLLGFKIKTIYHVSRIFYLSKT
jgi:hypothetical protein